MSVAELKAEIERLKTELRAAQARNTEIIRANVEVSNRRETKLIEARKEIQRLKDKIAKLRKKK
jgi:hypothetical protein